MRAAIASLGFILAACTPPPAQAPATTETAAEAPAGEPLVTGLMGGMSTTAAGEVAVLTVAAGSLEFANSEGEATIAAPTEFLGVVDATTDISANGTSFAEAAPGPVSLRVEVRRITGAAPERLCGAGTTATYVALASDDPITALTLIVFSGAEAPSPTANDSAVCATYAYAVD